MDKAGLSHAVQSRDISETDFRVLCREALWRCVFCRLPHQWLQPGKGKILRVPGALISPRRTAQTRAGRSPCSVALC